MIPNVAGIRVIHLGAGATPVAGVPATKQMLTVN